MNDIINKLLDGIQEVAGHLAIADYTGRDKPDRTVAQAIASIRVAQEPTRPDPSLWIDFSDFNTEGPDVEQQS